MSSQISENNITISNGTSFTVAENEDVFVLGIVDCVIVVIYMIVSISIGVYFGRKHKTAEDYFLAGRSMKWPFIGLSLFASNVSSSSLVGLAGTAYKNDLSVYNYIWTAGILLILFSTFFLPTILRSKIHTLPEMLELRYCPAARCYFSALCLILIVVGSMGGSLYGGALVVKMVFPQLETWHAVAILAALAGVYTIFGGLVAVIYTDALQAITLMLGSILIFVFALIEVGGWNAVKTQVPPEHLSLVQPVDDPTVPWTGILFGIPISGFYYWCTNQSIVQRILSAKNINHGRWGAIFSGFVNLLILFFMFPDLQKPNMVYPKLMFTLLPVGILGVVISGFLAALLSDVNSDLNSASTLITMDLVKKIKPDLTSNQLMKLGRLITFIVMIIAACWAPVLENFSSLYQYLQKFLAYSIPPVIALYLVGFFWKGANAKAAIVTLLVGNIFDIVMFLLNEVFDITNLHFLHMSPVMLTFSVLVLIGVSLLRPGECSKDQLKVVWSFKDFMEDIITMKEMQFWKNHYLHCLLLVIATAIIVDKYAQTR